MRIRSNDDVVVPNTAPTTYQEMVALGLGDYYQGLGVTGWADGTAQGEAYFRLGLVELGLLAPTAINDDAAFIAARNQYNQQYKPTAYGIINPEGTDYGSGFANNWNVKRRIAPMNFTQNITIGNEVLLFGKPLGFLLVSVMEVIIVMIPMALPSGWVMNHWIIPLTVKTGRSWAVRPTLGTPFEHVLQIS